MLTDKVKAKIQQAYSQMLEQKSLRPRWGQRVMIAEIAKTLARIGEANPEGEPHCVIEAGTGTGKTIAYSIAAIPIARSLGKKLVVSTATIALQEQFVFKDLPDIRQHSGLEFSFALAKGRRRYVCLSKLDKLMEGSNLQAAPMPLYPDEISNPVATEAMPVYNNMLSELAAGRWDGDRDNWTDEIDENIWFGVTTDHAQCTGRRCANVSQCAFFKARDDLNDADVIVTNHDLVLADLGLGGGAILPEPEDTIYVFDEGHHLPEKAINHFSAFCRLNSTQQWLDEIRQQWINCAEQFSGQQTVIRQLEILSPKIDDIKQALLQVASYFDETIEPGSLEGREGFQHFRFAHGLVPDALQEAARFLGNQFAEISERLGRVSKLIEDYLDEDSVALERSDIESWSAAIGAMINRADGNVALWLEYSQSGEQDQPPKARWVKIIESGGGQLGYELQCSPILAAENLSDDLWRRAAGSVVTSATLTALNSFDRFKLRSGMPDDSVYAIVPSPFHYENAVFSVPMMDCDPGDAEAHTQAIGELLPTLIDPDAGSLVLFSSRRQMLAVYELLSSELTRLTLVQGEFSKQEILRRHRVAIDAGDGAVIFGLASFAEGVDLPGKYCTHVIIAKIPFAVPDSPVESALSEWVDSNGGNAFMEISVPDAALRIVQASGRLLRSEDDLGRVSLLDRRIVTRRYGRAILDSLPPFKRDIQ